MTDFPPGDNMGAMLAQLEKQAALAHELALAARRHGEIAADEEDQAFLRRLSARQHLVEQIERGQGVLDRQIAMLEEKLSAASPQCRARVFDLIRCIRANLTEVLAVDAADSGRIASRLSELIAGGNQDEEGSAS